MRINKTIALHLSIVFLFFILQFLLPPFHVSMMIRIMILSTYAIGYNILLGYTGLMSLGHAMFFATGLYTVGLSVVYLSLEPITALLLALAVSILVSTAMGLLTLRTSGVFFLITTMIFSQVFFLGTLYFNEITGGEQGIVLSEYLKPINLGIMSLSLSDISVKYSLAWLSLLISLMFSLWLVSSPIGRILVGIRENPERTEMLGYNVFGYKLVAFIISGTISGIAGATYALVFSYIGSSLASILYSINPLLWVLLGGVGTTIGPIVGTLLITYVIDFTSSITSGYLIVVGATLVFVIMVFPHGIVGTVRRRWLKWLP